MAKPLVIVESPAKAKTLARFLGDAYRIEASYGHVRDLPEKASEVPAEIRKKPWGRMAVDTDGDFTPYYVVPADKKKQVAALKAALKEASELLLATDPDREGESISWHLREILKPKVPVRRIVFHEITEEAIREAHRGRARPGREPRQGAGEPPHPRPPLRLHAVAGAVEEGADRAERGPRAERGRPADRRARGGAARVPIEPRTGTSRPRLVGRRARVLGHAGARGRRAGRDGQGLRLRHRARSRTPMSACSTRRRRAGWPTGSCAHLPWKVTSVEARPGVERPAPPFTTSTLTQEASRKLGFSTERTMQVAQRLFQGVEIGGGEIEGLITYHRTDSTTLSDKALHESARVIREMFGDEYYTGPRRYQTRVKNAQEAHEAIRPTDFRHGAEGPGAVPRRRRTARLRARLEAHDGVADARRAGAEDDGRDHRPRAGRRAVRVHGVAARRSSSPGSAAPTSRAATTPTPSWRTRSRSCRP